MNKKISPKDAGKIRLKQVEYFKEKNNEWRSRKKRKIRLHGWLCRG
jgi:hypothetical protein